MGAGNPRELPYFGTFLKQFFYFEHAHPTDNAFAGWHSRESHGSLWSCALQGVSRQSLELRTPESLTVFSGVGHSRESHGSLWVGHSRESHGSALQGVSR